MHISKRLLLTALVGVGLTVSVGEAFAADPYVVDYRLTQWKSAHFHDMDKAVEFQATLKKLGCETSEKAHGGHIDVVYRCANWRKLSTRSHDNAHRWEAWLKSHGFDTRHEH